jgi:hypothetical protein
VLQLPRSPVSGYRKEEKFISFPLMPGKRVKYFFERTVDGIWLFFP